jgi:uncharacterized protein
VRDLGEGRARVEVDRSIVGHLLEGQPSGLGELVLAAVRSSGFDHAEIDGRGFRSGSMNELLPQPELFR